ncbi:hypothetical protein [Aureispira anguillae]|uniref:Uncharacterized protein n=1 Tax=Aureispira anguillae TaxID=2864201 RepID=A0A915YBJ5_9BACT|nr:hypothetical protein [Aureispira anguillae]BDS10053.1 hypothetical protein AsAng_0007580 [Aureispira anguillae]
MKKDIPIKKVTDIAIAVVPSEEDKNFWNVYLLNLKKEEIKNVFISSRGYGEIDGEKVETTQLRYFYEYIGAEMAVKIEPIDSKLFQLANEYWISFNYDGFMYDKKYVFVQGSFIEVNLTHIPIVEKRGVMIQ